MTEALRWGIIGTGGIARRFAEDLALTDTGRLVAVGSRTQASADRFAATNGAPSAYGSYEALVGAADVEAVYIATPHPAHFANAMLALRAGKHVLLEKPFTMHADEARTLVAEARTRNLFLMEAMKTRALPHIREINAIVARGELGEIVSVTADHGQYFAPDPEHRLFKPGLGGGALLDLGVYVVSFASMILGKPKSIRALITPAFTGVDAQTSMLFGYESGAHAVLTTTSSAKSPTRAAIVGTEARIEIEGRFYGPSSFTLIKRDDTSTNWNESVLGYGLRDEAIEAARCIREGLTESPLMPLDESIEIMETMDAVLAMGKTSYARMSLASR